jgi:4-hydroxy-3-methylbut-2-enyl diphosphate reductase
MLAEETKAISAYLRDCLSSRYGEDTVADHFADTRDTLCYATSENQRSIEALLEHNGDFALVVGGFNSSNTAHLAALCRKKLRTFHIEEAASLLCSNELVECIPPNYGVGKSKSEIVTGWLPEKRPLRVLLSAGASTPDSIVDEVISRLAEIMGVSTVLAEAWNKVLKRH